MTRCPVCGLPTVYRDEATCCVVTLAPLRRALVLAQDYRAALCLMPLNASARADILAQIDDQIAYLEAAHE